jgi:hypothetical protein
MDCDDALERANVTERVLHLLEACASHLRHENEFVHAAIEARAPGGASRIALEHDDHVRHLAHLAQAVAALRDAPAGLRFARQHELYAELSLFVADNFRHMRVEETEHNAQLWASYDDAELVGIHDALVASIPPQEMLLIARWLVPFVSPREREGLLADIRTKAPAPRTRRSSTPCGPTSLRRSGRSSGRWRPRPRRVRPGRRAPAGSGRGPSSRSAGAGSARPAAAAAAGGALPGCRRRRAGRWPGRAGVRDW